MRHRRLPAAMIPLLMLGAPAHAAESARPDDAEIERVYNEGDGRRAEGDFVGAADSWERLLLLLPENEENRAIRAIIVIAIADTLSDAYHRLVAADGTRDRAHLDRAIAILDAYAKEFQGAYGPAVPVDAGVLEAREEIEAVLPVPEDDIVGPCLQPCLEPPPCLQPIESPRGCGDKTPMAFVMLATLGLGIRRRRDALEKCESVLPADVVARLRSRLDRDA